MLIESGDLIPVSREAIEIPWTKRKTQILAFLHCGPVNFQTYVYDTNVGDIAPLSTYFNPDKWTERDLNGKFGNPASVEEITISAANAQGPNTTTSSGIKAKSASLQPRLMIIQSKAATPRAEVTEDREWSSAAVVPPKKTVEKGPKVIQGSEKLNEKAFICEPKPRENDLAKAILKLELFKRISDGISRPSSPVSRSDSGRSTGSTLDSGCSSRAQSRCGHQESTVSSDTELLRLSDLEDDTRPSTPAMSEGDFGPRSDMVSSRLSSLMPEGLKYLFERSLTPSETIFDPSQPPPSLTTIADLKEGSSLLDLKFDFPPPGYGHNVPKASEKQPTSLLDDVILRIGDNTPDPLAPWTTDYPPKVSPKTRHFDEIIPLFEMLNSDDLDKLNDNSMEIRLKKIPLPDSYSIDKTPLVDFPASKLFNICT